MALKIVTIEIGCDGEDAKVETEGMQGKGCGAIHEAFAKACGKSTSIERKREFNAPIIAANKMQQKG
jgi:hypothetical protein